MDNINELQPPIYSFQKQRMMGDVVWLISGGGLISPKSGRKCKLTRDKAGKAIMAYDVIRGPYFIATPGTDTNKDGNFDCKVCSTIDEAISYVENKEWKNKKCVINT